MLNASPPHPNHHQQQNPMATTFMPIPHSTKMKDADLDEDDEDTVRETLEFINSNNNNSNNQHNKMQTPPPPMYTPNIPMQNMQPMQPMQPMQNQHQQQQVALQQTATYDPYNNGSVDHVNNYPTNTGNMNHVNHDPTDASLQDLQKEVKMPQIQKSNTPTTKSVPWGAIMISLVAGLVFALVTLLPMASWTRVLVRFLPTKITGGTASPALARNIELLLRTIIFLAAFFPASMALPTPCTALTH